MRGDCPDCAKLYQKSYDRDRGSASRRGYDAAWQKARARKLAKDPLCECDRCKAKDRVRAANVVHHIKPVKKHPELRLVWSNLMSMAWVCHEVEEGRATE